MTNQVVQKPSVLVMMATYNGEKYVAEQIDSILAQEGVNVTLLISDDGSSDNTPSICKRYAENKSNVQFSVNEKNKGLSKNFMDMLYGIDPASYDYYAFSDQDDYWLSDKLSHAIGSISAAGNGPHLYYSDVCNVNEKLDEGTSEFAPFGPYSNSFGLLLTVNWASGCTMVFNSEFTSVLQRYEPSSWSRNHDGWVHLVARALNAQIADLDHAFIKRRISGKNQVGERGLGSLHLKRIVMIPVYLFSKGKNHHWAVRAASELCRGYSDVMDADCLAICETFIRAEKSFFTRLRLAFDPRFKSPYPVENALYPIKMILNKY